MKTCPYCAEKIQDAAIKCKHCGSMLAGAAATRTPAATGTLDATATDAPPRPAAADLDAAATISAGQIRPGDLLGGRYRITGRLGAGGMGEVWRAEDAEMDGMTVAVKVLPPVLARNRASVDALKREAQIALKLTHPAVCRLHTFHSDADVKFLVMEHIEGQTLEDLLKESGALAPAKALDLADQLAEALDYAHDQTPAILHRDIKPANIMIGPDGRVKLMDFGIAREIQDSVTRLSAQTSMTPLYASPEQFTGKRMTAASDLYSFTVVLHECLAGHPLVSPHGDLAYQILQRPFEPLEGVSPAINAALAAGLDKDPARRPATTKALVAMLRGPAGPAGTTPPPIPPPIAPPPAASPPTAPPRTAAGAAPSLTPPTPPAAPGQATLESIGLNLGSSYQGHSFLAIAGASFVLFAVIFGIIAAADGSPSGFEGATFMSFLLAVASGAYLQRRLQPYPRIELAGFQRGLVDALGEMKYSLETDHGGVMAFQKKYSGGFGWACRIYVEWGTDSARVVGPTGLLKKLDKKLRQRSLV